jgi:hypothetical protein
VVNSLLKLNEDGGFGPSMMFAVPGPGPDRDTEGIPSDKEMETGIDIKSLQKLKTFKKYRQFIDEQTRKAQEMNDAAYESVVEETPDTVNGPAFSIHDKKPGDVVEVEGRELTIVKFLSWVKNDDAKCITFSARTPEGKNVTVKYDDGYDGYIIK